MHYMLRTNLCDLKEFQKILQTVPSFFQRLNVSLMNENMNKDVIICHKGNFCHYLFGVIQCLKEMENASCLVTG